MTTSLRWRPSVLIKLTFVFHLLMLGLIILSPQSWLSIVMVLLANHTLLALIGLWPRSNWLGPNWTQLPAVAASRSVIALTIDDGPDPEVTPVVLDLLDRYQVKATFFCVGEKALLYPELCRSIMERGHAVENHSQRHRHYFAFLGPFKLKREIQAAQETLTAITGRRPLFFRAPAGLRNPMLDPVLAVLGLRLVTWTHRGFDTRTVDPATVIRRLQQNQRAGNILLLHDGNCARSAAGVPIIVAVLPSIIEAARDAGLHFVTLPDAFQAPVL